MPDPVAALAAWDAAASGLLQDARTGPLAAALVVASAWWVKGLLLAGLGGVADLRRGRLPHTALWHPRLRWAVLGLAAAVALSRVYLGVHFTSDVLAGAALGTAIGLATVAAARPLRRRCEGRARAPAARWSRARPSGSRPGR